MFVLHLGHVIDSSSLAGSLTVVSTLPWHSGHLKAKLTDLRTGNRPTSILVEKQERMFSQDCPRVASALAPLPPFRKQPECSSN